MKICSFLTTILLCVGCVISTAQATVVVDFNTGTGGFVAGNGSTISQSSFNGGSLQVDTTTTGAAILSFAPSSAIGMELTDSLVNGGSITFDAFVVDPTTGGGLIQIQLGLESDFGTQTENVLLGQPDPATGAVSSNSVSISVISDNLFNGTDGFIQYRDSIASSPRSIQFGFNNSGDGTFFIDNLTVSANAAAVPEPSSLFVLCSMTGVAVLRRRRRRA